MGFIGSRLISRLVEEGESVVVLDSLEAQVHRNLPSDLGSEVELVVGSVGNVDSADHALRGVDRVVHLAAVVGVGQSMYEIARYVQMNSLATATFLERLVAMDERPRRLVVASSMSIYGEGSYECPEHGVVAVGPRPEKQLLARDWEPRCPECSAKLSSTKTGEDKRLLPTSVYAVTKRDHEELALVVGEAYGIPTVALRFFNVYGPGQALSNPYTGVAAIFSSRLINGNRPLIFEDGNQSRDFIHVDDIVTGILLALNSERAPGRVINLGTGRRVTIREVASALSSGLGVELEPEITQQFRAGDIRHCYADTRCAEEVLSFRACIDLEVGMADLVRWVAEQEAEDAVATATDVLRSHGLAR
jgi:dTDP-L-rhamnose 4-epimerase